MTIDINLLRKDRGGNPDLVKESERRRFRDTSLVDKVIELDEKWRKLRTRVDHLLKYKGIVTKATGMKYKKKEDPGNPEDPIPEEIKNNVDSISAEACEKLTINQLKKLSLYIDELHAKTNEEMKTTENERDNSLHNIGNLVHESVVISNDEQNNGLVRTWGEPMKQTGLLNHVDIMRRLGCMNTEAGTLVAGSRGYFTTGFLTRLNLALQCYAMQFLSERGYTPIYTPFFMEKKVMGKVAQLEQFDEELYKVTGEGDEKYLIATSEQPLCAYNMGQWLDDTDLPIRYAGISSCFRKEVGSHGKDTLGIFRVHQFEKIEQFCITSPKDDLSWKMMEEMIKNAEDFYQSLKIPYRVVNIVSGALNNAAAKKLDLEAWFPASQTYRELVSCSNCTDYQSRRLDIRYGKTSKKSVGGKKEYVHMLNATLCATTRTMCCIVENYQTPEGVNVPEVLQPYMGGIKFVPFVRDLETPKEKKQDKKKK